MGRIVITERSTLPQVAEQLAMMRARARPTLAKQLPSLVDRSELATVARFLALTPVGKGPTAGKLKGSTLPKHEILGLDAAIQIFQPAKPTRYRWDAGKWTPIGEGDFYYVTAVVEGRRGFTAQEYGKRALAGPGFGPRASTGPGRSNDYPVRSLLAVRDQVRSYMVDYARRSIATIVGG